MTLRRLQVYRLGPVALHVFHTEGPRPLLGWMSRPDGVDPESGPRLSLGPLVLHVAVRHDLWSGSRPAGPPSPTVTIHGLDAVSHELTKVAERLEEGFAALQRQDKAHPEEAPSKPRPSPSPRKQKVAKK